MRDYSITLDKLKAKAFSTFLHSLNVGFEGSECGEHIYFSIIGLKPTLKPLVETFLDKI